MSHAKLPVEISDCINACAGCHQICVDTATYCLEIGGKHADVSHVRLLLDCEQICRTTEDFLLRGSDLHGIACNACALVCDACAASCDQLVGDAQMAACAKACRDCADACRRAATVPMPSAAAHAAKHGAARSTTP